MQTVRWSPLPQVHHVGIAKHLNLRMAWKLLHPISHGSCHAIRSTCSDVRTLLVSLQASHVERRQNSLRPMASSVPVNSVHSVPVRPVRTVSKVSQAQVISGHGKRQQWQKALALLERCENDGSQVPLVTFNASLGGPWRQALKPRKGPLEQSERSERWEDVVTLNQRLKALVTATAWQVSMQLMAATAALGLQLTVVSYTTGIKVVKGVSWRYATQLLAEAAGYSLADLMMYNAAMSACERDSQWQQAVMLLEEAQLNFHPDLFSFNTMISAFGKAQHWQQAVHILMNLSPAGTLALFGLFSSFQACWWLQCFLQGCSCFPFQPPLSH